MVKKPIKKRKRKKAKQRVIQHHHPDYTQPNLTVPIFKGEHWTITKLTRKLSLSKTKKFSKGFLFSLQHLVRRFWDKAVDLEDYFKNYGE